MKSLIIWQVLCRIAFELIDLGDLGVRGIFVLGSRARILSCDLRGKILTRIY
ncbi:MAG: hypothetical protein ACTTIC_01400 [Helicobacteraceae bacterium]